jgi:hypothetical protein
MIARVFLSIEFSAAISRGFAPENEIETMATRDRIGCMAMLA